MNFFVLLKECPVAIQTLFFKWVGITQICTVNYLVLVDNCFGHFEVRESKFERVVFELGI